MTCSFTFCLKPGQTLLLQVCQRYQITSIVLVVSISLLDNKENTVSVERSHIGTLNQCNINSFNIDACFPESHHLHFVFFFFFFPAGDQNHYTSQGLWVILGLLVFLLLEKMFPDQHNQEEATSHSDLNFNCAVSNGEMRDSSSLLPSLDSPITLRPFHFM